jgi:membrane-bound metal-dependent hydrolase YbcI (DUF457 family)
MKRSAKAWTLAGMALAANVPDLPLPFWGHGSSYGISHSLFINLLLIGWALGTLAWRRDWRRAMGGWPVLLGGAAAWVSHLLLDSFYNHGLGIAIGWPFGHFALNLPIPFFRSPSAHWLTDPDSVRTVLVELAFYGALLAACAGARRAWNRRASRAKTGALSD